MATVLEEYTGLRDRISAQIAAGQFPPEQMLQHQEMLCRINVLETCMAFGKTAPVTMDQRILSYHYQMLDYLSNPHVQNGYMELVKLLSDLNFQFGTYLWDPQYKGLDDYVWEHCYQQGK